PNSTLDLIGRIERGAITALDRPDVPESLVAVLRKGMAKNRTDRFDTAVEFARALQRVELELGYAPTSIDVPNLGVARVSRDASAPAEDETRMRSVATVVAQPAPAAPPAESTRLRGAFAVVQPGEATVLRPAAAAGTPQPAASSPTTHADAEVSAGPQGAVDSGASRRRRVLVGVIVACIVLIGGGITAAFLLPQSAQAPQQSGGVSNTDGDGGIVVATVPDATIGTVTRSAGGTSVTFVWKNPKPKKGDTYQWTQEGTSKPPVATTEPTAVVDSLAPGTPVCIDVLIIRDGRTSANALKECTP
ncbi:MAG: serine/threonine protein kinase, partial [Microbacteriaceae bacterium]